MLSYLSWDSNIMSKLPGLYHNIQTRKQLKYYLGLLSTQNYILFTTCTRETENKPGWILMTVIQMMFHRIQNGAEKGLYVQPSAKVTISILRHNYKQYSNRGAHPC
jgi:hypothetical protein